MFVNWIYNFLCLPNPLYPFYTNFPWQRNRQGPRHHHNEDHQDDVTPVSGVIGQF